TALDLAKAALAAASVAGSGPERKAAGTSFWKKLTRPSICSSAISVKMRGGFLRFLRASAKTCGICFSRSTVARRRVLVGAKGRSMRVKIELVTPEEELPGFFSQLR